MNKVAKWKGALRGVRTDLGQRSRPGLERARRLLLTNQVVQLAAIGSLPSLILFLTMRLVPADTWTGSRLSALRLVVDGATIVSFVVTTFAAILISRRNERRLAALSERLQTQAQTEEQRLGMIAASKMALIGEMYTGMAHEINNPLSVIQGHLARIERAIGTPEQNVKTRAAVADVHATIRRITRIISGLRGFARDSENEPLQTVGIGAIVEDSVSMLEERIVKRGITLVVDTIPDELGLECRPTQISQVLVNLLSNACDAVDGRESRLVRVFVRDAGDRLVLTVADTGVGVAEAIQAKVMQPFFTTKPEGKGTGLGLSISSDIVARHGGKLEFAAVLDETHFRVHLPKRI